ncbi:MAG: metallophosphoesterase [Nanoarchaeota archaeon]
MKFTHMADCHIGCWRDPKLKDISLLAFLKACDMSVEKEVDFILISGDLFNTSLPAIDSLKSVVKKLKELKKKDIPVYIIAGSHDFSPSGKTMIDVLEEAELVINVLKGKVNEHDKLELAFTVDKKTGAKITGMLGKRGMLERKFYENLELENLEKEKGFKIFMFHSAISELKPKELDKIDSSPISYLPKGFDYYAGGHVHIVSQKSLDDYKHVVYPGPIFPANFQELESLERGGFYLYDNGKLEYQPVQIKNAISISIDAAHKSPEEVMEAIREEVGNKEYVNTIVLIRLAGMLKNGRPADINLHEISRILYERGAYVVMVNRSKLESEEFEEIKISQNTAEDIEEALIKEHLGQVKVDFAEQEEQITRQLIKVLSSEKSEGESLTEYNSKIKNMVKEVLRV